MTDDEPELIHSPLTQTHSADGHTLRIHIYRGADEPWILEVVDELGTSTVWNDTFDTDTAALDTALAAIAEDGIGSFVAEAQRDAEAAQPEHLRKIAELKRAALASDPHDAMAPLSEEELDALDHFLLYLDEDEAMTLAMLDGYLHAIAVGPETLMPSQWLPQVWGQKAGAMMPPAKDLDEVNLILSWVMRHFNSIISGFEQSPLALAPLWDTHQFGPDEEFEDAEAWAHGFTEGVKLNLAAWQPLFDDAQGQLGYRPIGLLGADDFSPDQDALTRTPALREALSLQIEASLAQIHAFWMPLRHAVQERETAQHLRAKVGRNEPCPCASGKKFKKCCGAASVLH